MTVEQMKSVVAAITENSQLQVVSVTDESGTNEVITIVESDGSFHPVFSLPKRPRPTH